MKVLQIGKFYPIRGGVEKVMHDLMLGLSARKVHCDMLCASTENYPAGTVSLNAYARLLIVPTYMKFAATMIAPAMITYLRKIVKEYDLVHIHHPDPMACLALRLSGYSGKVVLHWHSDILKQRTLLRLYTPLQRWLINRADLIVGTSPIYVQESVALNRVQHKVDFIPIGVEPICPEQSGVNVIRDRYAGKKIIFSLGRLVTYKGYEYLIKAAQQLDNSFKIIIGGTGPLYSELTELIQKLGVEDRVELIGFVSDEDLPSYYGACDLFCLSSIWKTEAFAIVQIEAMSCGKPIVSTHIPGSGVSWVNVHEVSGLVVKVEEEKELAMAIQRIFADEKFYRQLAAGSKNRYAEYFTRENMIDKCLQLYTKVYRQRS